MNRRDILKTMVWVPVLGGFALSYGSKRSHDKNLIKNIQSDLNITGEIPEYQPVSQNEKIIRLGLIGFGIRGKQLAASAGFVHPETIEKWKNEAINNKEDKRYEAFLKQDNLNVQVTGVCDIFDTYGRMAQEAAANVKKQGKEAELNDLPKRYSNFRELIHSPDVDAVIIATPDHWHGPMTIEAARAGKHVYVEKPLTWSVEETYEVRKAVKENNIAFQLGHQGRQSETYIKAREVVKKNVIGKVSLIEVSTNRNDPNGAWVYEIHKDANPQTIDWQQFIGQAPFHPFSLERFFRWRCWWDYSTGLSGDLLTHEYDAMNQIFDIGIPHSAVSSGGIYYFKDGRTVPDVLQTVFEYPDKELSLIYSATLASNKSRGRVIMGHDGYIDLGSSLTVYADSASTRYKEKIEQGIIDPELPIYTYTPGIRNLDAVTSPTSQYFAGRGLMYSYRSGKRIDTTHLHIREWLDAIRHNTETSCNIDRAFEEAITAHMGTLAYRENRKTHWDIDNEIII